MSAKRLETKLMPKKESIKDKNNHKKSNSTTIKATTKQQPRLLNASELQLKAVKKNLPASTRRVKPLNDFVGQTRAKAAIQTALNIHASGYNVFASGKNGLGKRTMIMRLLKQHAKNMPAPNDWAYVNNFEQTRNPIALAFPAGDASVFKTTMYDIWEKLLETLKIRFRADRYLTQVEVIREKISHAQQDAYHELTEEGKQLNLQLVSDEDRHHFIPIDKEAVFDDSPYVAITETEADTSKNTETEIEAKTKTQDLAKNSNESNQQTIHQENAKHNVKTNKNNQSPKNKKVGNSKVNKINKALRHQHIKTTSVHTDKSDKHMESHIEKNKDDNPSQPKQNPSKIELQKNQRYMQRRLKELSHALENLEVKANKQIDELNTKITLDVIKPLLKPVFAQYKNNAKVVSYLQAYQADVVKNVEAILRQDEESFMPGFFESLPLRYQINVVVSQPLQDTKQVQRTLKTNKKTTGAPVIFEDMPTHYNLIGNVEQVTHVGSVTTDFSLIRAGSLHKANGGFLVLEALSLLEQPYAWQGLKRALQSKQIKLSSLEQMVTLTGSISLEPDTIPLDVKVILLGEPALYYELLELEPEFDSVFKIRADFSNTMPRTPANESAYVQMIADYVRVHDLLPFDRSALASLIENASKQAEEQHELSLHAGTLGQMLLEANSIAVSGSAKTVSAQHIAQTIDARYYRMGYLRELYWQNLARGYQLISSSGEAVGQINALTVVQYADSEFGLPTRLTASIHQGNGDIIDVERDVNLAGNLHAKGMLIMSSYLRALFGQKHLLSFTASLTFEQNYGQIDGDSATLAEACALISALSGLPIDQSWAITGSMNQFGDVQPIGGVNAKIEGFFDTCLLQSNEGLTGSQGVIIPIQNQSQLMLRDDVLMAVKRGEFKIYAINHVNQALEKLLNHQCGKINKHNRYPKNSIFGRVMTQLSQWHEGDDSKVKVKSKTKKAKNKPKNPSKKQTKQRNKHKKQHKKSQSYD